MTGTLKTGCGVAAIAAIILVGGAILDARTALAVYLVAWIALGAIPIGALGVLMVSYLVRRDWTQALRPVLVATAATLPVVGALFIPVLLFLGHLYPAASDPASLPAFKAFYLAPWFFAVRTVLYFVIWSMLAWWLRAAWADRDRMARAASAGLIVYTLVVSLAGVDWIESLEPDFHSSIYGLLYLSFVLLDGVGFAIGASLILRRRLVGINGYSSLLLSTILLWAYLHAMQYIVIWSANIPDEAVWYLKRAVDGWQFVIVILAAGQVVFPFFALLSSRIRRWLAALCGLTLAMRICEAALLILPAIPRLAVIPTVLMLLLALALVASVLFVAFEVARANDGLLLNFAGADPRKAASR